MAPDAFDDYSHEYNVKYSDRSALNTLDLHIPLKKDVAAPGFWVVYLHGGAWRDLKQDSRTLEPTLHHLHPAENAVAGVASVNYSLSKIDAHSEDTSLSEDPSRNAQHPDHIQDVLVALQWLQQKFKFGENYVLAGHSAGAFLAYQVAMCAWKPGSSLGEDASAVALPLVIVGSEGLYDHKRLLESFADSPFYRNFVEAAFGKDESKWAAACPTSGKFHETWPNAKAAILAHSDDDELVDWRQTESMSERLWHEKVSSRRDIVLKSKGLHNTVWEEGSGMAELLIKALAISSGTDVK